MKEHPILFSGPMVRAILDDRKTQTRRVVKQWPPKIRLPQLLRGDGPWASMHAPAGIYQPQSNGHGALSVKATNGRWLGVKPGEYEWMCPYGKPGDTLYVRETWQTVITRPVGADDAWFGDTWPGVGARPHRESRWNRRHHSVIWRADGEAHYGSGDPLEWRPSIHMPRWASRILLEVTAVRVERVQNITEADAIAEGCSHHESAVMSMAVGYRASFAELWDSLNAKPKPCHDPKLYPASPVPYYVSYPWEDIQETREHRGKPWYVCGNPWVWVVGFKRSPDIARSE